MYDIDRVRQAFLGLHRPDEKGQLPLLFDGPGGSQLPQSVVQAMSEYLLHFNSNMGGYAHAGCVTAQINADAREAAATWFGCTPQDIVFGLNATSLMFHVARTLSQSWQAGDNIVVSALDHFSHVSSWERAAADRGVKVRFVPLTADGSDLAFDERLIDERTRLVAVSLASNVLGTKPDVAPIIKAAKKVGAKVSLDAVHAIVHDCPDVKALGCDVLFASAYKFGGARLGMAYLHPNTMGTSPLYKVAPASDDTPFAWEVGTQSFEAQSGLIALLDYWCAFGGGITPREQLKSAYQAVQAHEHTLGNAFLAHAKKRPYLCLYGKETMTKRTPTFAFNLITDGKIIDPKALSAWCGKQNIALPSGNFYAQDAVHHLGLAQTGFVRAGFLHYNTLQEVDKLFEALDEFYTQARS